MLSTRNTQVLSADRNSNLNVPATPAQKTSTSVVNSLARGLLASSPGQASLGRFVDFQFGMGKKPSTVQSYWLGLRKIARQMDTIELQATQAGRELSGRDRKLAARRAVEFLHALLNSLGEEEKSHPSFRKELIEHLENIVRWYPRAPHVWALAYKNMLPGELVRYKDRALNKSGCRSMMCYMHAEAEKAHGTNAGELFSRPQGNTK